MDWKRIAISVISACIISLIIFLNLNDFGITWDEPIYFARADHYFVWVKTPRLTTAQDVFRVTTADYHPPFRKLVGGLTHEILVNQFHLIDNTRGYRISALLFVFPFVLLFTYLAIGQFGYCIGILTPFVFSFMPHVFFLTPLMTTDYAMAVMWFTAVVVLVPGLKNARWLPVTAVLAGFVMLTKLYGALIVIPITVYWAWKQKNSLFKKKKFQIKFLAIAKIVFVLFGSAVTYVIFWPWLWTSPVGHFLEYFIFQFSAQGAPVAVFGQTYVHAPYWYTLTMLFSTTPIFVLAFFVIGTISVVKKGNEWDWIFLLNAVFPLVFFSLPGVYRYDGIRLFLIAYPFICLVAARGIQSTVQVFTNQIQPYVVCVIFIFWIGTVYASVIRIHPWESSYYNELVGGISGASRLGLETEFWGNAFLGILPWMNANKKDMMCVYPTTHPFYYYQAMGQIEGGVVFNAGRDVCKYMVVLMRQGMFTPFVKHMVATDTPVYQLLLQGVPLVGIYDIEGK